MFLKMFMATILILASSASFALTEYKALKCSYNDPGEEKQAKFTLNANMSVTDTKTATLSYSAVIRYVADSDYADYRSNEIEKNLVFAVGKNLKNTKYNGRKYNNHFKFELDWTSVGGHIEYADFIISKEPLETTKDEYGATIEIFRGALNVSYNDHHGDTVWIQCTRRFFNR